MEKLKCLKSPKNEFRIPLTKGRFAIVDEEFYGVLLKYKWCVANIYAYNYSVGKMHRIIVGAKKGEFVDHKDGNPLNNTKSNLRVCTSQQNMQNARPIKNGSSIYKGVSFDSKNKKWLCQITHNYKNIFLGRHQKEHEAAEAYNKKAIELFGQFAWLNKIPKWN